MSQFVVTEIGHTAITEKQQQQQINNNNKKFSNFVKILRFFFRVSFWNLLSVFVSVLLTFSDLR